MRLVCAHPRGGPGSRSSHSARSPVTVACRLTPTWPPPLAGKLSAGVSEIDHPGANDCLSATSGAGDLPALQFPGACPSMTLGHGSRGLPDRRTSEVLDLMWCWHVDDATR